MHYIGQSITMLALYATVNDMVLLWLNYYLNSKENISRLQEKSKLGCPVIGLKLTNIKLNYW